LVILIHIFGCARTTLKYSALHGKPPDSTPNMLQVFLQKYSTYGSCQRCCERNRAGEAEWRKRKRSEVTAPPPCQAPIIQESRKTGGSSQHEPVLVESSDEDISGQVSQYIEEITQILTETAAWL
jgi:hypothetical protein